MTHLQKVAYDSLARFVRSCGGDPKDITQHGKQYRWLTPAGATATVNWED